MSTISVPINRELEEFIDQMIKEHKAETKAEVVRRALYRMREEKAVNDVLEAERDVAEGRVFRGNLKELANSIKD